MPHAARRPPACRILSIVITLVAVVAALVLLASAARARGTRALVFLGAGLLAGLLALAGVIGTEWVERLDLSVAEQFGAHKSRKSTMVADSIFGFIGRPEGVGITAALVGALLSVRARSVVPVVVVMGAVAAAVAVEHALKATVGRTLHGALENSSLLLGYIHSYPSGHVAGSAALLGTIGVVVGRGRPLKIKRMLASVVGMCVLAVALMALYVHAHLLSDVIGGMFLGGAVISLGAALIRISVSEQSKRTGRTSP
jgi:undecaprenyl-diphosphatase